MKTTTKKWAYYNENDARAAAWIRELMNRRLIMEGEIDERSIKDVRAEDVSGFIRAHWFAGIAGWDYAIRLAGIPDNFPVWTASCPCQPFSQTGKQMGNADSRHLFPSFRKLVARCNPTTVIGEQVASKLGREWLARVRLEMATLGYATRGSDLCSAGVRAPNIRQRLYWMADADGRKPWNGKIQSSREYGQLKEDIGAGRMEYPDSNGTKRTGASQRQPDAASEVGGLVQPDGTGRNPREHAASSAGHRSSVEPASAVCGLGNSDSSRPQRRDERGHGGHERTAGTAGLAGTGFWDSFDILHCTDGKARRIEPGTFPLASGISGRVGKLRGYGNAINVQLAAAFIQNSLPEACGLGDSGGDMLIPEEIA